MKHVTLHLKDNVVLTFNCQDIKVYESGLKRFSRLTWEKADKTIHFDVDNLIAVEVEEGANQ